ncbi:hypothetical protein OPT61_g5531 [Boeremia exigua]|uniref:Uncharacterized protein n=1 Tax=Boeremia exigua TaxID=749465 RepID=A0ACC2IA32_9PLEO|nr:hypothetical protein OPT61_g5531 [Boeremia exigua]
MVERTGFKRLALTGPPQYVFNFPLAFPLVRFSVMTCKHTDVREFDGLRSCLACGETRFETPSDENPKQQQEYLYTDLRCLEHGRTIRMVILQPGDYCDPIQCSLVLSGLQHADYEAVSYTWATEDGDDHRSQRIEVDNSLLFVTKNCEATLRRLRERKIRRFWMDALCINQANTSERNHQVGLMDDIYREANCVHACIEAPGQDFSRCMRWLSVGNGHPKDQLASLFALRYFSRVWVIQEVALARKVILHVNNDSAVLTKKILSLLRNGSGYSNLILPPPLQAFLDKHNFDNATYLLHMSISASCSDPRDQVYGTISLLPPVLRMAIPVDYSLRTEQVFANAICACIQGTQSLEVLQFARLDNEESELAIARSFGMEHLRQYLEWATHGARSKPPNFLGDEHKFLSSFNFDQDANPPDDRGNMKISLPEEHVQVPSIPGHLLPCFRIRALLIDLLSPSSNIET